jgi:hypothetical protein
MELNHAAKGGGGSFLCLVSISMIQFKAKHMPMPNGWIIVSLQMANQLSRLVQLPKETLHSVSACSMQLPSV